MALLLLVVCNGFYVDLGCLFAGLLVYFYLLLFVCYIGLIALI